MAVDMSRNKSSKNKKGPTPKAGTHKAEPAQEVYKAPTSTPLYIVVAAIGAIVTGLAVIILSFLEILPNAPAAQYNLVGLVFMCIGFVFATQIK